MSDETALLILNYLLPCIISIFFLVLFLNRFVQLHNVARHNKVKLNLSLSFRITCLVIEIIAEMSTLFVSTFANDYYAYHNYIVLIILITTLTIIIQIILMIYEFNKNVPLFFVHKLFWILLWFFIFMNLIILLVSSIGNYTNYLLDIFRFVNLLVLNIYSLFIRRQDIYDFEKNSFFSSILPQVQDSYFNDLIRQKSTTRQSISVEKQQYLEVQLLQGWSIIQEQGEVKIEVKLNLQHKYQNQQLDSSSKLTVDEFVNLQFVLEQVNKDYFDRNPVFYSDLLTLITQLKDQEPTQLTMKTLADYILKITTRIELASKEVLEFFKVPQPESTELENKRKWKLGIAIEEPIKEAVKDIPKTNKRHLSKMDNIYPQKVEIPDRTQSDMGMVDLRPKTKSRSNTIMQLTNLFTTPHQDYKQEEKHKKGIDSVYLQYFDVKVVSNTQQGKSGNTFTVYGIEISLLLPSKSGQQTQWVIQKRYTDFYELDQTLKVFLGIKQLPLLPKKKIITLDEEDISERKHGLEQYLRTLLNDKIYHHYSLFRFIQLSKELEEEVKSYHAIISDNLDIENIIIESKGFELVVDEKNKYKTYVRYTFHLNRKNGEILTIIQKRFSQFIALHDTLKKRFQLIGSQLPEPPSRITTFGQKTSSSSREKLLTSYLTQLLAIPNLQESIHFRQFIDFRNQSQKELQTKSQILSIRSTTVIVRQDDKLHVEDLDSVFKSLDELNQVDQDKLDILNSGKRVWYSSN